MTSFSFQPDGSFLKFGYEAIKEYSQLVERDQHRKYHYFEKFKMTLYEEKAGHAFLFVTIVISINAM